MGDLELITRLKESSISNSNQLRSLRKKRLQVLADIEAALEEVTRLARNQGRLMATYESEASSVTLKEHRDKLNQELFELEQEINILQCDDVITTPDASRVNRSFSFDDAKTSRNFQKLGPLYEKRNELKCSVIQVEEQIRILETKQAKVNIDQEEELLYGPMPREPMEKLFPNQKLTTIELLRNLMSRLKTN
ncbi:hypothetical protein Ciccas_013504 [Cichlidogyrus casuarinus]|uniref:Uncharacterized protein n=1 Tax=Cichlidogyrus casuarinus TaxID=1844966 RepID=A0ABD2PQG7_9PLAT